MNNAKKDQSCLFSTFMSTNTIRDGGKTPVYKQSVQKPQGRGGDLGHFSQKYIPDICHLDHLHVGGEEICHVENFQISIHDKWGEI